MKKFYYLLIIAIAFSACSDDDPLVPAGKYTKGFFIVNEGAFTDGNATIDFVGEDNTRTADVFQANNNGAVIGSIANDMKRVGNDFVIPVNNSNSIIALDVESFQPSYEITTIAQPRYVHLYNESTFFATAYGSDGVSGGIYKITDGSIEAKFETENSAFDHMLTSQNQLFVSQSGGYNNDNKLLVLDPLDMSVLNTVEVGMNPSSLAVDNSNMIWVLCDGYYNWAIDSVIENTKIIQYDPFNDQILKTIDFGSYQYGVSMVSNGSTIYFNDNGAIKKMGVAANQASDFIGASNFTSIYQLSIDAATNRLFVLDAGNFVTNGSVYEFSTVSGNLLQTHEAGIIPTEILIVD